MILGYEGTTPIVRGLLRYRPPRLRAGVRVAGGELILVECPFCGQDHWHGRGDGHRVADCSGGRGYIVREVPDNAPIPDAGSDPRAISSTTRARVFERDRFRCRRCGRSAGDDGIRLVIDHIVPVAGGGGGEITNLQTLCDQCNTGKGVHAPVDGR